MMKESSKMIVTISKFLPNMLIIETLIVIQIALVE